MVDTLAKGLGEKTALKFPHRIYLILTNLMDQQSKVLHLQGSNIDTLSLGKNPDILSFRSHVPNFLRQLKK